MRTIFLSAPPSSIRAALDTFAPLLLVAGLHQQAGFTAPGYACSAAQRLIATQHTWRLHLSRVTVHCHPPPHLTSVVLLQAHSSRQIQPPLVVHACTSAQRPLTTGLFFQLIQQHFTQHPPPFRVLLGAYPRYQGANIVTDPALFRLRSALAEAKFTALACSLRAAGRGKLAARLYNGWKVGFVFSAAFWCKATILRLLTSNSTAGSGVLLC